MPEPPLLSGESFVNDEDGHSLRGLRRRSKFVVKLHLCCNRNLVSYLLAQTRAVQTFSFRSVADVNATKRRREIVHDSIATRLFANNIKSSIRGWTHEARNGTRISATWYLGRFQNQSSLGPGAPSRS